MPGNPLEKSIKSGIRMNDRIGDLFAKVGTSAHPRGDVLAAYRNAERAMRTALTQTNRLSAATDVMRELRKSVQRDISSIFSDAVALGEEEVQRQLQFYDVRSGAGGINLSSEIQSATDVVMARLDAQDAAIRAMILSEADDSAIVGDEDRGGVLSASEVITAATFWATFLVWNSFDGLLSVNYGINFQKQAIAALDMRTTDCCLRVHGQVQNINAPFKLTGTPRFQDRMDWPGFHYYCRTSVALYAGEYDDGLTKQLRESARWFLNERKNGRNPDRNPADAFA